MGAAAVLREPPHAATPSRASDQKLAQARHGRDLVPAEAYWLIAERSPDPGERDARGA